MWIKRDIHFLDSAEHPPPKTNYKITLKTFGGEMRIQNHCQKVHPHTPTGTQLVNQLWFQMSWSQGCRKMQKGNRQSSTRWVRRGLWYICAKNEEVKMGGKRVKRRSLRTCIAVGITRRMVTLEQQYIILGMWMDMGSGRQKKMPLSQPPSQY